MTPGAIIVPTTPQDPGSTLAAALDIGLLTTAAISYQDMYGVRDPSDYYRFTIDQPREVQIALADRGEGGWMRLIADLDADGVVDGGEQLRDAGTSGSANLGITQKLEAGDYFIEVRPYWNGHITPYSLTVTPGAIIVPTTPQDPGSTLAAALDIGLLTTAANSYQDMYGVRDQSDYYRFRIDQPREVQIALADRGEGGWMRLITDLDADGVVDSGEQLRDVGSSSSTNVNLTQKLEAGDYFIEVRPYWYGHITPYSLTVTPGAVIVPTTPQDPGQTLATAFAIGPLSTTPIVYSDLYGVRDTLDVYRFEVTAPGQVRLQLTGRSAGGWIRLISDANSNGTVEWTEVLKEPYTYAATDLEILLNLAVGTYFVEVRYASFGDITPYTLSAVRVTN